MARLHWFRSDTIFFSVDILRAIFSIFFGREKICFLSSREYTWRVYVFNGVLIHFGSYLSHLFPRLPIGSWFRYTMYTAPLFSRTYKMRPCFFVVTAHTVPVILFMVCFWHILHRSLIQFIRIAAGQNWRDIDQHFSDIFFFLVLTAALCVRSSDIIAVIGITFTCILKCCFGQDWLYFSQWTTFVKIYSTVVARVLSVLSGGAT